MNDDGLRKMLTAIAVTLLICGLYVAYRQTLRSRWQSQLDEFRKQGLRSRRPAATRLICIAKHSVTSKRCSRSSGSCFRSVATQTSLLAPHKSPTTFAAQPGSIWWTTRTRSDCCAKLLPRPSAGIPSIFASDIGRCCPISRPREKPRDCSPSMALWRWRVATGCAPPKTSTRRLGWPGRWRWSRR